MSSAGLEAVDLAASAGLVLDDWQCWWLDNALSERADGNWCAADTVLITGRQSGKNGVLAALELAGLFLLDEPLIIHSAHEVPTALNHFEFMRQLIDGCPDLSRKCLSPVLINGREAIRLRSGAQLKFRARLKNSGRGLTAGRVVFDEAFDIRPQAMGALIPTTRAIPNRQFTYASSAPKASSVVLHSLIRRGRGDDPDDRIFYAEWGNPAGTDLDDVDAWYEANPALGLLRSNGTGIEEATLLDEYRTLVSGGDEDLIAEFSREAVGIGEAPEHEAREPKLPPKQWADTIATKKSQIPKMVAGELTIVYDVDRDGGSASISIAHGTIGESYIETIDHQAGTAWLPARLVRLVKKWNPIKVGCNGAGPAGAQVADVRVAFREAGFSADLLIELNAKEYQQACGGFYTAVAEGRITRVDDGPLTLAGQDATDRALGDAWVWDRRQATVPISPLVAATIARALLPTEVEVEPESDFIVV